MTVAPGKNMKIWLHSFVARLMPEMEECQEIPRFGLWLCVTGRVPVLTAVATECNILPSTKLDCLEDRQQLFSVFSCLVPLPVS